MSKFERLYDACLEENRAKHNLLQSVDMVDENTQLSEMITYTQEIAKKVLALDDARTRVDTKMEDVISMHEQLYKLALDKTKDRIETEMKDAISTVNNLEDENTRLREELGDAEKHRDALLDDLKNEKAINKRATSLQEDVEARLREQLADTNRKNEYLNKLLETEHEKIITAKNGKNKSLMNSV